MNSPAHARCPEPKLLLLFRVAALNLVGLTACEKIESGTPPEIRITSHLISTQAESPMLTGTGIKLDGSGELKLLGILSEEQTQELLRRLEKPKAGGLMNAPVVTSCSGQKVLLEIMRECIYPTELDSLASLRGAVTPTTFQLITNGGWLEVTPELLGGTGIKLTVTLEAIQFEGVMQGGSFPATSFEQTVINNRKQHGMHRKTTASAELQPGQSMLFGGPGPGPVNLRKPETKGFVFFIIRTSRVAAKSMKGS